MLETHVLALKQNTIYLALRKFWVGYKLIFKHYSYLNKTGFIKSHQLIKPVDAQGEAVPWMNYAIVELLKERMHKGLSLFEYGAGFSSVFFAKNLNQVVSIEYDKQWEQMLRELLNDYQNHQLIFSEVGPEYINAVKDQNQPFDLVLVDGRERVACAKAGFEALSSQGILILDDSDRDEYQSVFTHAQQLGFRQLRISGLKPFSFAREESTFFYRNGNCLGF